MDQQTPSPPGAPNPPSTVFSAARDPQARCRPGNSGRRRARLPVRLFPRHLVQAPRAPVRPFPHPGDIKFPVKPGGPKPLVLPRRPSPLQRAQEASQATAAARKSIDAIMSQSRPPWGGKPSLSGAQVEGLEKALRELEAKASQREMALAEAENKLAERDRALAETEALLQAREKVIDAMRKQPASAAPGAVNPEEMAALVKLKEELDRQEASIKEQKAAQAEREEFLNQSEASLFEKMQAQQEKENRAGAEGRRPQKGHDQGRHDQAGGHGKGLRGNLVQFGLSKGHRRPYAHPLYDPAFAPVPPHPQSPCLPGGARRADQCQRGRAHGGPDPR